MQTPGPGSVAGAASTRDVPRAARTHVPFSLLFLAAGLLLMAGATWGPWVNQPSPGLALLGLDLAEYVKFLPEVRSGQITVSRELFYLPLFSLSLGLSIVALTGNCRLPAWLRAAAALLALPCAFALLPPAWSPATFGQAEYRLQLLALGLLTIGASLVLLRFLWRGTQPVVTAPARRTAGILLAGLALVSSAGPLLQWQRLLGAVERVYNHSLALGWGGWALVMGGLCLFIGGLLLAVEK